MDHTRRISKQHIICIVSALFFLLLVLCAGASPVRAAGSGNKLTVVNGTIASTGKTSGTFLPGDVIRVVPKIPQYHLHEKWVLSGTGAEDTDVLSENLAMRELIFVMPEAPLTVTANFIEEIRFNVDYLNVPLGGSAQVTATIGGRPYDFTAHSGMKNCTGGDYSYRFPDAYTMEITGTEDGSAYMEWSSGSGEHARMGRLDISVGDRPSVKIQGKTYLEGEIVTLTADVPDGWYFEKWSATNGWLVFPGTYDASMQTTKILALGNYQIIPLMEEIPLYSISISKAELTLTSGQSVRLTVNRVPEAATAEEISWSIWTNAAYTPATLDQDGTVTALDVDHTETAIVTAATKDRRLKATCTVTIKPASAGDDSDGSDDGSDSGSGSDRTSMYRLYNPNSGEHFYTANAAEKDYLSRIGWNYEGIGWTAPKTSSTPVYRLYNPNAGDHHYTMNPDEKDMLVRVGWNYEGIGWYSDDKKGVPLYRQYNPNAKAGSHNYTTSKAENDMLVRIGWRGEGIGWYGMK